MQILPLKTRVLAKNFNLLNELLNVFKAHGVALREGDILAVTSKIVALSQGRVVQLDKIKPSKTAQKLCKTRYGGKMEDPRVIELTLKESEAILPGNMLLTIKDGLFMPAAGIDLSNVPEGFAILLPKNVWGVAEKLLKELKRIFKLKKLGIAICDSHCRPLRWGTTGIALAWAGFAGVEDNRGKKDIYGKPLKFTKKAMADNLAAAAAILMGESNEKIPFALIRGASVKFISRRQRKNEIFIRPENCLFSGIYNKKVKSLLWTC